MSTYEHQKFFQQERNQVSHLLDGDGAFHSFRHQRNWENVTPGKRTKPCQHWLVTTLRLGKSIFRPLRGDGSPIRTSSFLLPSFPSWLPIRSLTLSRSHALE